MVYSESWEEHLQHLDRVLSCLKEAGLTAEPSKCQFAMDQCVYLGHMGNLPIIIDVISVINSRMLDVKMPVVNHI